MRGKGVTQRVRVKVIIDVYKANILLHDAADRTLGKAAAGVVEEDGFRVGRSLMAAGHAAGLSEKVLAERPIFFHAFLGLRGVRDAAVLVSPSPDTKAAS